MALDEFRASTKLEPEFLMGYWGEAMAHNHPIWGDPQDTETAREVLKNLKDMSRVTPREQAYLRAVQILYGEGDKRTRDKAYAEAMEKVYQDYPDDLEAAAFYALALLGTVREMLHDPSSTRTRMKAAAIARDVIRKAPNHPGAVHYLIHAFDDPDHAILALPAARRYAEIAPEAHHALHMPSHIFLQLGMWSEAAAANEHAWAASNKWVQQNNLPVSQRDYHSLHWLLHSYLQQGRYHAAEELLERMDKSLAKFPPDDALNLTYAVYMRAVNGDFDEAARTMRKAIARAAETPPPSGPPLAIKPTHELFGEILLRADRPEEAAEQFATSLFRHPSRARSLLGAARAAAQSGNTHDAVNFYRQFEQQWQQTDTQTRELRESRAYLKQEEGKKVSQ